MGRFVSPLFTYRISVSKKNSFLDSLVLEKNIHYGRADG